MRITDPSNPGRQDFPVKATGRLARAVLRLKAKVNHDAGPAIAQWAMYWARHKGATMPTEYDEVRPIPFARSWLSIALWGAHRTVVTDCSGSADIQCALAGVDKDPTGQTWKGGAGNSKSFYDNAVLLFTDTKKLLPGDFAVYGIDGADHIATIVAVKPEIMVVSHGQPGGPFLQPLSLDTRPRTFVRIDKTAKVVNFPPRV